MIATNIADYIQTHSTLIEQELDRLIPARPGPSEKLFEAARYVILEGGKRLRPLLTLATVDALKGNSKISLTPACTLELIHTYSMIHDDLPCMDDDDYRRGKLTLHKKYNEGHAVLTGDFLLTYAFEVLAVDPHLTPDMKVALISTLAQRSGSDGMIGGQVMDIANEGKQISLETLRLLHLNKTAALITAAVEFGGIIAGASSSQFALLRNYGEAIGLAFQIIDDILDVTDSCTKHGRTVSSDVLNEKTTYVTLLGIDKAKDYAHQLYEQARKALQSLHGDTSILLGLADLSLKRKY